MGEQSKSFERYLVLYLPWLLSILIKDVSVISYLIAWLGSFFIFFIVYSGWLKPLPADRKIPEQLMRPVFLVQIIFIGYMACSSIFYFLNILGYGGIEQTGFYIIDSEKLDLAAQCQRYYVLGHAAFATGMVLSMRYPIKKKYKVDNKKLGTMLLIMAIICLLLSILTEYINGLLQFSFQFSALSFISGTLALAFAIPLKKVFNTLFCVFLYLLNFYQGLTSGFKEPIIISVLVLGVFLYPEYKKIVLAAFVPALLLLFIYLPTYNHVFRESNWEDNVNADDAYKIALDATFSNDSSENESFWRFLVYRLSEIDMFTIYIQSTPDYINYYNFQLIDQATISVIPRIFWPAKPNTESMVMQRVYNAGVINRNSSASAKPAYIVDGYLSGGILGIFLALFVYGAAVQIISQKAEQLFGGYILGTALIFSGLFQIFWRGLSFEFLLNSVFWSYISMLIIHRILRHYKILERV
ncbi:MAG TPA: hypothetical protein VL490_01195 [Mucilaginibacter sp.]|jgi:hypothetical protein|nr:hypothetical protein [Mucilaginibacter sp.]